MDLSRLSLCLAACCVCSFDYLVDAGFAVQFHKQQLVSHEQLELDLYLPALGVAIEIDGPSHFLPIYGEDALMKTQLASQVKNGLLIPATKLDLAAPCLAALWLAIASELPKVLLQGSHRNSSAILNLIS
mgnify:CR=1 FL=1